MNGIANYFQHAELAFAAYSNLAPGMILDDYEAALRDGGRGMSRTQAERFASSWRVVDQFNDSFSGLSATVFEEVATGRRYLAIRGTNDHADWLTNLVDIGVLGTPVRQAQYASLRAKVQEWLANDTLASGFSVSGHSLGGFLASALAIEFAEQIAHVYLYNTPGLGGVLGLESVVEQVWRTLAPGGAPGPRLSAPISHIASSADVVPAIGVPVAPRIGVQIESMFDPIHNHAIATLVDALALHDAYGRLAPALTVEDIGRLLRASSARNALTLEAALDGLRVALLGEAAAMASTAEGDREAFYGNLYALTDSAAYRDLAGSASIRVLAPGDARALDVEARSEFGSFLALRFLLPFVIEGGGSVLAEAHAALHTRWSADRGKRAAGASDLEFTDEYLADRAQFLGWKNQSFTTDGVTLRGDRNENLLFENRDGAGRTDLGLTVVGNLAAGGNSGAAANPARILFGGEGADRLTGGILADRLYGGAGTDWLEGGAGDDYLEGGSGLDLYGYNAFRGFLGLTSGHDGADVIRDADGRGVLRYAFRDGSAFTTSVIAGAFVQVSGLHWASLDGRFSLLRSQDDLVVTFEGGAGGSITLKDFREGDFGIRLLSARSSPETGATITGDLKPVDFDPVAPGTQTRFDALGNVIVSNEPEPDRQDVLFGDRPDSGDPAKPGEKIVAGGGDDLIFSDRPNGSTDNGFGNADWILGGSGRDWIEAGAGDDRVEAGPGADVVDGGAGDDELYGDAGISLAEAIAQGHLAAPDHVKGDLLAGGAGRDWIAGSWTADLLLGGAGEDLIVAGAGDDHIWGDLEVREAAFDWTVVRTITVEGGFQNYRALIANVVTQAAAAGGADVIHAGAGDDWVFAGQGDDFVDAGPGDDVVFGEAGSDVLIAGAGSDVLVGDNPGVVPASEEGADYLDGGDGNDVLFGNGGDDVLVGGPGNDILLGGAGRDIYVFRRGDGRDTLFDSSTGADASVLVFEDGFDPAALTIRPGSLVLDFGEGDALALTHFDVYDPDAAPAFGSLHFADGTILGFEDVIALGFDFEGTDDHDDGRAADRPLLVGTAFNDRIRGRGGNDTLIGLHGDDTLDGGAGNDRLFGDAGNDTLIGGAGADQLIGGEGDDRLHGGADRDALWGGAGDDYLEGGPGHDFLFGELGDDRYAFDEEDTVVDFLGATTIVFTGAERPEDIELRQTIVNGLPVFSVKRSVKAGGDPFASGMGLALSGADQLAGMTFADGTKLVGAEVLHHTLVDSRGIGGTPGDDVLTGYAGDDGISGGDGNDVLRGMRGNDRLFGDAGDDLLDGGSGNDELYGGTGDDVLIGGAGDDLLVGGDGADGYVYARGDGQDVIADGGDTGSTDTLHLTDLHRDEVSVERRPSGDLRIAVIGSNDGVTVSGHYHAPSSRIERIVFADGTAMEAAELDALTVLPIEGTAGDDALVGTPFADVLIGGAGNDILDGGGGDDILAGGAGVDTYRLNLLPGQAILVEDDAENSIIRIPGGLSFEALEVRRAGDDLVLRVRNAAGSVLVPGYYAGRTNWAVETGAGETKTLAELVAFLEQRVAPRTLEEYRQRYLEGANQKYQVFLAAMSATGSVVVDDQGFSDDPVIFRAPPFDLTFGNGVIDLHVALIAGGDSANLMDFRHSGIVIADGGRATTSSTTRGGDSPPSTIARRPSDPFFTAARGTTGYWAAGVPTCCSVDRGTTTWPGR
jgi:Ca2+-binding RTX toxin-like protein